MPLRQMFCDRISQEFKGLENVEVHVRDEAWAKEKGMVRRAAFLDDTPAQFARADRTYAFRTRSSQ